MADTAIEWTDKTWNPVVGCTKISAGCKNCYAKAVHDKRHKAYHAGKPVPDQYRHPFEVLQTVPGRLGDPLSWRKPQRVFVNSVSDLFHDDVPFGFIDRVFAVMARCQRHTFQVLTKRADRMRQYFWEGRQGQVNDAATMHEAKVPVWFPLDDSGTVAGPAWPLPNVWLGVSVEDQKAADERIPQLLATPAAVRFLSCEPLLSPVRLDLLRLEAGHPALCRCGHGHGFTRCPNTGGIAEPCHVSGCPCRGFARRPGSWSGIDWCVVGGESGPGARPCRVAWVRSLVRQCRAAGVACFVKQLGANVIDRNDQFGGWTPEQWPQELDTERVEDNIHGFREEHQGADVRVRLIDRKGGETGEWPEDLRVREFPEVRA